MLTTPDSPGPAVRWDLSALFESPEDPALQQVWAALMRRAEAFATTYRGRIESPNLDATTLAEALRELEEIEKEASKPMNFASLIFAGDTSSEKAGAFMQRQMELSSELSVKLLFFNLELQALDEEPLARLLQSPALENYRHAIEVVRTFRPFRLSEKEEIVLEEMANTGSRAWERLFEEVTANQTYPYRAPGSTESEELSQAEVIALLRHPDRAVREAAGEAFTEGLRPIQRLLVFNYNNLMQDKAVKDQMRGYGYPEQARHLSNELQKETVDLVVELCRQHYPIVARYYRVKREILGLAELSHIDRYSPLFESKETIPFEEAKRLVLEAFGTFSETMEERAREFFDRNWIDAEPRKGKRGGAFCCYNTPDTHPVVLQSYLNKMDDVMTLAHELGHGVHASLSRRQTYFNFHGTLPLAELASTFGEMLVFEKVAAGASPKEKLQLYAEKIEGLIATIFRQAAMFEFERRCHTARRAEGELPAARIESMWQEELQAMFGDSLTLGEEHRLWWSYVGHFIGSPFYVYAYSFGELLVMSLYQMAKQEGAPFATRYIQMLELGGSKTPHELMRFMGVDLDDRGFWVQGFERVEKLVEEFEALWKASN